MTETHDWDPAMPKTCDVSGSTGAPTPGVALDGTTAAIVDDPNATYAVTALL